MKGNTDLVNIILLAHSLPVWPTLTLARNRHFGSFPSSGGYRNNRAVTASTDKACISYHGDNQPRRKRKFKGSGRVSHTNKSRLSCLQLNQDIINARHSAICCVGAPEREDGSGGDDVGSNLITALPCDAFRISDFCYFLFFFLCILLLERTQIMCCGRGLSTRGKMVK